VRRFDHPFRGIPGVYLIMCELEASRTGRPRAELVFCAQKKNRLTNSHCEGDGRERN